MVSAVLAAALVATSCSSSGSGKATTPTTRLRRGKRQQASPTVPSVQVPSDRFGIASGVAISRADQAGMNKDLDGYKAVGSHWLRTTVKWNEVQPDSQNAFDWSGADRLINGALARGLQLVIVVNGTPGWAQPPSARADPVVPPTRFSDYAEFLRQIVNRYKDKGVRHWELGNEPNHDTGWAPTPDPVRYAELLKVTYPVIKSADPNAVVLTGGLGGTEDKTNKIAGDTFLRQLYEHGAKGNFDVLSYHPYTYPFLASENARSWERMLLARRIMEENGDGDKQIWATEYGAPTGGGRAAVSEERQAQMVSDAYSTFTSYPWAGPLFWFSYRDKSTDGTTQKDFFGILHFDYTPKPAAAAYKLLATGTS